MSQPVKNSPGQVRDAIVKVLESSAGPLSVKEIQERVGGEIGATPASSIRSYLRLNTPSVFVRESRGVYRARTSPSGFVQKHFDIPEQRQPSFCFEQSVLHHDDCFRWIEEQPGNSVHAVVTDPPYGLHEYSAEQQTKLRAGRGGVWRIPPSFDGNTRSPLPRFTTLDEKEVIAINDFFYVWASLLKRVLTPGANVIVASNPLVSHVVSNSLAKAGLERRGRSYASP